MRVAIAAALGLLSASFGGAQTTSASPDLGTATPIAGNWTYAVTSDGSEATFTDASGHAQLWLRCTRSTRRVTISKLAGAAAPLLNVWTSSLSQSAAASFDPATGRLTIDLANYDPLLDAIASSRGRVAFSVAGQPPLVIPPWAEVARVIEDCRA